MPPYQGGGEMIASVSKDRITYADPPTRFEAGTPAILEAIGFAAAIRWLQDLDRDAIAAHEHGLYERVKSRLNGANWITEIGQAPGKGAIFSFNIEGAHAHDVAQILDKQGRGRSRRNALRRAADGPLRRQLQRARLLRPI